MELLAPAGSVEAFHAAVEAGANAVYLGLEDFNARIRTKNFTVRDLSALLPYAHSRNTKIYVTMNTLIKQSEIKSAINTLYQLDQLGADAVIVADLGLMKLASTHFPNLRIHGSTQAAAHNSYGVETLKSLGAKRVVLARELSIDEIGATVKKSPLTEIEVFIHGALCYSISGLCLASSFIGGASGNRGKCTQVCRRKFKCVDVSPCHHGKKCDSCGYFFSPYDLQAVTAIPKLAAAGVTSLKIEGRMKSADYVHTVVKAYRDAIDFPGATELAVNDLCFDFGRAKTMFFLDGRSGESAIDPSRPSGTGTLIGVIGGISEKSITLSTDMRIFRGDRLRVQPRSGFEGIACKVADCNISVDIMKIGLTSAIECNVGDYVFLIGRADKSTSPQNTEPTRSGRPNAAPNHKNIRPNFPNAGKIADALNPSTNTNIQPLKPKLWFKADNVGWLEILNASPCQHLIFDADINELNVLIDSPGIIKTWRSRIFIALPPFIEETNIHFWRDTVKKCMAAGLQSFAISNIGHLPLVNKSKNIAADALLWCLNRFTQKELSARGVSKFVYSYEDEYLNIRNTAADAGIAPLYGNPPLFISRMKPGIDNDKIISDPHGGKFTVRAKNNLYYTLPETPMCLFAKREKLSSCGIGDFLIDVSFINPDYGTANKLIAGYKDGVRVDKGSIFNFKAGLR
ncbi:MAG: U32 family peptidase [Chitinispirillia bacterium]|nr:U32 family peptidase [Chitinispirillia bacterium]MCL2242588.1 U32 family peptidase [Chitinispirillia bacterium]